MAASSSSNPIRPRRRTGLSSATTTFSDWGASTFRERTLAADEREPPSRSRAVDALRVVGGVLSGSGRGRGIRTPVIPVGPLPDSDDQSECFEGPLCRRLFWLDSLNWSLGCAPPTTVG